MSGEIFDFLIFLILVCLVVAVVLWAVKHFFSTIYEPARYVVGAFALVAVLVKLKPIIASLF